ncbi:MAG TPA: TetR/AcrR family transcriptional regulator [Terriglobales bacterium]|nr:TetR/AcrR family transcriptional regulator [Terriglobales bacterium]
MPPHSDPLLENRILDAARKLWHKNGERALTMRAVAQAAGSNTPAVYRRFRNRDELLRALVESYQQDLFKTLEPCRSLREFAECYLDFAFSRPREYQLLMSGLLARVRKERPNLNLLLQRSAEWLGGAPEDYEDLGLVLFCLAHGAVMHVLTRNIDEDESHVRKVFACGVDVLVSNARKFRGPRRARRAQ